MLKYIETNIKEKLNVEKLAARAGFSQYHFCRVFQWEIGFSVMEYVRNRKLAYAASELSTGKKIVDIAIDYGFDTHSGFSKAFRRYFGCSPERYRIYSSFDIPKLPILQKTKQYVNGGIVMEPKLVKKEAVKIAGFAIKTTSKDGENLENLPKFWHDYIFNGRQEKIHKETFVKKHDEYGVCFPENPGDGEFKYVIGVEVKEDHEIPKEYFVCIIPEALYAVFSTPPSNEKNFSKEIQGTWKYIFSEWFPNSGYEFANGKVDYELYTEQAMGETGKICEIYVPVVKRS